MRASKRVTARRGPLIVIAAAAVALFVSQGVARAEEPPVKEKLVTHVGWEANQTTGGTLCTEKSGDICQPGKPSSQPGGFRSVSRVAIDNDPHSTHYHHVYVLDRVIPRVQEFDAAGELVSTFGWDVNQTKDSQAGATQAERNICTVASGDECGAGKEGSAAGQLGQTYDIAIDPASGDIYIAENAGGGERLQRFSADGAFELEIGKQVNQTKGANVCTAAEGSSCGAPTAGGGGPDEFSFDIGSMLAFGGGEDLLYVGEYGRVQELTADGVYKREIPLESISKLPDSRVSSIAVDPAGNMYLVYREFYEELPGGELVARAGEHANVVYKLSPGGQVVHEFTATAHEAGGLVEITSMALDPAGRLGVSEFETYKDTFFKEHSAYRGVLDGLSTGRLHLITEFTDLGSAIGGNQAGIASLAFSDTDEMFATDFYRAEAGGYFASELLGYTPVAVGEPLTDLSKTEVGCKPGPDSGTNATVACRLEGEVNPYGVPGTDAWFQWGIIAALGNETPVQKICEATCGEAPVEMKPTVIDGLRPNQSLYYRTVATDENVQLPELLLSETVSLKTQSASPRIVGSPEALFIRPFAADLSGEINPENARTTYAFQFATAASCETVEREASHHVTVDECPGVSQTGSVASSEYGTVAASLEAKGLQPATAYRYRLYATNENGQHAVAETGAPSVPESTFLTSAPPQPQASTGGARDIGTTTATLAGTINPNGPGATYAFELATGDTGQLTTIFTSEIAPGSMLAERTLRLTNLQPGTTYTYRIEVSTIYGVTYGAPVTFQTPPVPPVIQLEKPLPVPMPKELFPCKPREKRDKHDKCVVVFRKKHRHKSPHRTRRRRHR